MACLEATCGGDDVNPDAPLPDEAAEQPKPQRHIGKRPRSQPTVSEEQQDPNVDVKEAYPKSFVPAAAVAFDQCESQDDRLDALQRQADENAAQMAFLEESTKQQDEQLDALERSLSNKRAKITQLASQATLRNKRIAALLQADRLQEERLAAVTKQNAIQAARMDALGAVPVDQSHGPVISAPVAVPAAPPPQQPQVIFFVPQTQAAVACEPAPACAPSQPAVTLATQAPCTPSQIAAAAAAAVAASVSADITPASNAAACRAFIDHNAVTSPPSSCTVLDACADDMTSYIATEEGELA